MKNLTGVYISSFVFITLLMFGAYAIGKTQSKTILIERNNHIFQKNGKYYRVSFDSDTTLLTSCPKYYQCDKIKEVNEH